jgi:hypothetical protein
MATRNGRIYREIGIRPEHDRWIMEQIGGKRERGKGARGISRVVEQCIARTMKHSDAADRIDRLQAEVDRLKEALEDANDGVADLAAFLKFQVWMGVGKNRASYEAWMEEFRNFELMDKEKDSA